MQLKERQYLLKRFFWHISKKYQKTISPPTLQNRFSMLKTTIKTFDKIDISIIIKLILRKKRNYIKTKSKIFTAENVSKFCNDAPDELHLARKIDLL